MNTVKQHDRYPITFTVNMDLTGWTVRLLARRSGAAEATELECTAAGDVVTHTLTGELATGDYAIEVEASKGDELITFPTAQDGAPQYEMLRVIPDLG